MGSFGSWASSSQDELLTAVRLDDGADAMAELIRRFEPLVVKIGYALSRSTTTRDDLMNEARLALVLAARRHQIGHPGFARYAEMTMWGAARRWGTGWAKGGPSATIEDHEPTEPWRPTVGWGNGDVARVVADLPAAQQSLLAARYVDDADLGTIASATGTSTSAVSQRLRTAHKAVVAGLAA